MRRATPEHLAFARGLMRIARHESGQVECTARIVFHAPGQEAVHVITPAPRYIAALMAGGYVHRERVVGECPQTGLPMFEGDGEIMGPMTYDEAVAFVAWKDMPAGTNNFRIVHVDDLPRISGSIDSARKFRAAWRLEDVA